MLMNIVRHPGAAASTQMLKLTDLVSDPIAYSQQTSPFIVWSPRSLVYKMGVV